MIHRRDDCTELLLATVLQSDNFAEHPSVIVLPISSMIVDAPLFRITVHPSDRNGLRKSKSLHTKEKRLAKPLGASSIQL